MNTSYADLKKSAQKSGTIQSQTPVWFEFKKKGDSVLGRLLSKRQLDGVVFDGTFIKYGMDTDTGPVEFKLGAASDKDIGAFLVEGAIYEITMLPDEDIGKASPRHSYEVILIPESRDPA